MPERQAVTVRSGFYEGGPVTWYGLRVPMP